MVKIGKVIRAFRIQRKLTLKELSSVAEISASYLSQIENDQVNMNMSVLENLSQALNVPIYMFFMHENIKDISLVRRDERSKVLRKDKVTIELLTGSQIASMSIHIMDIPPGHLPEEYSAHQGEEFLHVLEGRLVVDFNGYQTITLEEEDSVSYSSRIPHRIFSEEGCRVLVNSTSPPRDI
jgi:transcriptional regulator with XRE-family HTH domain